MKFGIVGEGAQGQTHLDVLKEIEDIEVISICGGVSLDTEELAKNWNINDWSLDYDSFIENKNLDAIILCSPNQVHCEQAIKAMDAGLHVLIEIPMGISLEESRKIVETEKRSGKVCMVGHTLRFSPEFKTISEYITEGKFTPHHIIQQTYFFRRKNENRFGKERSWVDDLLWHQACHMVDMVHWLLGNEIDQVWGQAGPLHPSLNIPMDLSIGMRANNGVIVTSAQSFNHHGPIQSDYRIIGTEKTLFVKNGKIMAIDGNEVPVQHTTNGFTAQNIEFITAIREDRVALTSCSECLPVMETIDRIQKSIDDTF